MSFRPYPKPPFTGGPKAKKPIPKRSPKRTKEERVYDKKRKEFLETKMVCEVKGCNCKSTEVHHKAGRVGELYLNELYWLAVCHDHHVFITNNDSWAKENGYCELRTNK